MRETIDHDPRRFFGAAALTFTAAELGLVGAARAETNPAPPSVIKPGTNTSFGPLKQIDAGGLNVGYAELGPLNGSPVFLLHGWPALHWNEDSSDSDNQALAAGFPGLGLESTFAGSAVNAQFMVKDSKKYAASGGWGFADFTKGKPGDEALHAKCFPCHAPAKDSDYVFTRYAPTPGIE
jgi:hypothetical protein